MRQAAVKWGILGSMERAVVHDTVPHQVERESFAQQNEVARWFYRFYEDAFQEFLNEGSAFHLPDQRDLRDAFDQNDTSPLGKRAHWRDVTEAAAEELLRWVQASRAKTSAELRLTYAREALVSHRDALEFCSAVAPHGRTPHFPASSKMERASEEDAHKTIVQPEANATPASAS